MGGNQSSVWRGEQARGSQRTDFITEHSEQSLDRPAAVSSAEPGRMSSPKAQPRGKKALGQGFPGGPEAAWLEGSEGAGSPGDGVRTWAFVGGHGHGWKMGRLLLECIKACASEQRREWKGCSVLSNGAQGTIILHSALISGPVGSSFRTTWEKAGAAHLPTYGLARCSFLPATPEHKESCQAAPAGSPPAPRVLLLEPSSPRPPDSLGLDFQVIVARVAHFTESGHKEVITAMVGWGVLLDVGKLHKLSGQRERTRVRGDSSAPHCWYPQAPCMGSHRTPPRGPAPVCPSEHTGARLGDLLQSCSALLCTPGWKP